MRLARAGGVKWIMKTFVAALSGLAVGVVFTLLWGYYVVLVPMIERAAYVEENEIPLYEQQIQKMNDGQYESVLSWLHIEVETRKRHASMFKKVSSQ